MMFRGFLERVARDPAAFASRSYLHPANGFYKVELGSVLDGKLRLHVWPGGWEGPGHIHDHRWDFISHILHGELYERRFNDANIPPVHDALVHTHPYDVETLRRVRTSVELASVKIRRAGETYSCRAGEIHQFWPVRGCQAATLVLTGPPNGSEARVFTHSSRLVLTGEALECDVKQSYESKALDPNTLYTIVKEVLSWMK